MPRACMVAPFESRPLSRPLTENCELTFTSTVYRYPFVVYCFWILSLNPCSRPPSLAFRFPFPVSCPLNPVSRPQSPRIWKLLSRRRGVKYSLFPTLAFTPHRNQQYAAHSRLHTHSFKHLTTRPHLNPTHVKHGAIFAPSWPRTDPCLSFQRCDTSWLIRL
jgi:hypothetical protein